MVVVFQTNYCKAIKEQAMINNLFVKPVAFPVGGVVRDVIPYFVEGGFVVDDGVMIAGLPVEQYVIFSGKCCY